MAKVEDRSIPGPGPDIPVRIYTPEGSGPFPGLVWFHGGGWVVGTLDTADGNARHMAAGAGCVVVSVGYRLAPEAKFPAAADDSYAATRWMADNAASINVDPARIAVGGDSAGGNLAAVVSLMARDRGGPPLVFQLLVYPATEWGFDTIIVPGERQRLPANHGLNEVVLGPLFEVGGRRGESIRRAHGRR